MTNLTATKTDFTQDQQPHENAWLKPIRDAASERLTCLELPTQKTEDWK